MKRRLFFKNLMTYSFGTLGLMNIAPAFAKPKAKIKATFEVDFSHVMTKDEYKSLKPKSVHMKYHDLKKKFTGQGRLLCYEAEILNNKSRAVAYFESADSLKRFQEELNLINSKHLLNLHDRGLKRKVTIQYL